MSHSRVAVFHLVPANNRAVYTRSTGGGRTASARLCCPQPRCMRWENNLQRLSPWSCKFSVMNGKSSVFYGITDISLFLRLIIVV